MDEVYSRSRRFTLLPGEEADIDLILGCRTKPHILIGCLINCSCGCINHIHVFACGGHKKYETDTNSEGFFRFKLNSEGWYLITIPQYHICRQVFVTGSETFVRAAASKSLFFPLAIASQLVLNFRQ